VEKSSDHLRPLGLVRNPLKDCEMVKHIKRRHPGIDTELLRQIAEDLPHFVFLGQNIEVIQLDCAGIGILQGGDPSHQGALARSVGSKQTEHVIANS
jgi:hypothetical protein